MNERVDTTKAAVWALLAALALSLHVLLAAPLAGPQLYGLLAVLGFGLVLPPIATIAVRFSRAGPHAAVLAAMSGTAACAAGIGALAFDDLEPGALLFLGMFWWVVGKFSVETGTFPRAFGYLTMALSVLAFVDVAANVAGLRAGWIAARLALAAWLLVLAWSLYRSARADAR